MHGYLHGEYITENDRDEMIQACYRMVELYKTEKNWYDAVFKLAKEFYKMPKYYLECMWRSIDAYVDIKE